MATKHSISLLPIRKYNFLLLLEGFGCAMPSRAGHNLNFKGSDFRRLL